MPKQTSHTNLKEIVVDLKRFDNDGTWFERNYDTLRKEYASKQSQFVAIKDKKVVDHDPDFGRLVKRLEKQFGRDAPSLLIIEPVTKDDVRLILRKEAR